MSGPPWVLPKFRAIASPLKVFMGHSGPLVALLLLSPCSNSFLHPSGFFQQMSSNRFLPTESSTVLPDCLPDCHFPDCLPRLLVTRSFVGGSHGFRITFVSFACISLLPSCLDFSWMLHPIAFVRTFGHLFSPDDLRSSVGGADSFLTC